MKKSFHGRSMGALSITGKATYQEPFAPMLAHVKFADFNNLDSVKRLITKIPVQFLWKQYKVRAEFILPLSTLSKESESFAMRTKF